MDFYLRLNSQDEVSIWWLIIFFFYGSHNLDESSNFVRVKAQVD